MTATDARSAAIHHWRAAIVQMDAEIIALKRPDPRRCEVYETVGARLSSEIETIKPHLTEPEKARLEEIEDSLNEQTECFWDNSEDPPVFIAGLDDPGLPIYFPAADGTLKATHPDDLLREFFRLFHACPP